MVNKVRVEAINEGIYDLPDTIGDLINKFCEIRHGIPKEYRDVATVYFECADWGSTYSVVYWREQTPEEIKAETDAAEARKAHRIQALEAELARLR